MIYQKTLVVITGPTGSGKTDLAIELALRLGCEIISADSRQMYRDLPIGTAAPTASQLARVKHHLVGNLSLTDYYSAAKFEKDVLALLPELWLHSDYAVMCGGSMMYIDAVCDGIDRLPTVSDANRAAALAVYEQGGLDALKTRLAEVDPQYLATAPDLNNHKRLVHALEISMEAGVPYSSLLTGERVERPFNIIKLALNPPREVLFDRINRRVDAMVETGLEAEARSVYPYKALNSLNTVGYKEMFAMFDGVMDRETAIARIGKNTRVYAKKQLTWLKRDDRVIYIDSVEDAVAAIKHA
ncbi:MAG: tRNA (adenosine(37)-N6)-dimethylallyltransferase MiaA [Muribaculaceae bacterium]|nr:tRNA (adenosine(37)-N6)-dimethylallyltransferase MiaA [Muribaculaceae bacterium]